MATGNIISVCNRSLLAVASRTQIASITENSVEARACNTLFQPCFEALARTAHWNCLRFQATLSLLQAATGTQENPQGTSLPLPPTPWRYAYALPPDCLQARFIVPAFPSSGSSQLGGAFVPAISCLPGRRRDIPFQVAYGIDANNNPLQIILTNQPQAQLVYTVNQSNPQIWDSLFQEAFVQSLGAWLVPPLSLNMPLMGAAMKRAEEMIEQAKLRDGNEGPTSQDHIPDWINARNGGALSYGAGCEGWGYQSMTWPV